jgi:hypothetical protein
MTDNLCGSCTLCCKLMEIEELAKPAGSWCPQAEPGQGCKCYGDRPASCRVFECIWLQTQKDPAAKFPPHLRPDRCRAVLTTSDDGENLIVHIDPSRPDAHKEPALDHLIRSFVRARTAVILVTGSRRKLLTLREVTL